MKLNIKELKPGQIIYICNYRHNDIDKKPIRAIKPTEVMVFDNEDLPRGKKIYYSPVHFIVMKKLKPSKTIIAPCDNTGYRMSPGTFVNMFNNMNECIVCFNEQMCVIENQIRKAIYTSEKYYTDKLNEMNKMKNKYKG